MKNKQFIEMKSFLYVNSNKNNSMLSKKMNKIVIISIFLLNFICSQSKTGGIYSYDNFTEPYIDTIIQTTNDTIWVSTKYGKLIPFSDVTTISENELTQIKKQLFDSIMEIKFRYDTVIVIVEKYAPVLFGITPVNTSELIIPRLLPELSWQNILNVMNFEYKSIDDFEVNEQFIFCKPYSNSLFNSIKSSEGSFLAYIEHFFSGVNLIATDDSITPDSLVLAYNNYYNDFRNTILPFKSDYLSKIPNSIRNTHFATLISQSLKNKFQSAK